MERHQSSAFNEMKTIVLEANYECTTFASLLKKYPNNFKVKKGKHDHLVSLIES